MAVKRFFTFGDYFQSTRRTSIGSEIPFNVSVFGELPVYAVPATVSVLARISPPFACAAMRAASWTPFPARVFPTTDADDA